MNRSDTKSQQPKRDVYQTVTDAILASLEQCGPFERPWLRTGGGLPVNAATGNAYRGSNVVMLWVAGQEKGYATDRWATFKQWLDLGAQVKKGEKGTPVIWFQLLEKKSSAAGSNGPPSSQPPSTDADERKIPCARLSWVFNAAQVENAPAEALPTVDPVSPIQRADELVARTGATIRHGGDKAYYQLGTDSIVLPERRAFVGTKTSSPTEAYYSTLLHELTHWTGPRLQREFGKRFGDDAYAFEELVAELGSAFLCASLGISDSPREDHASYLAHWSRILKNDRRAFVTAASKAAQATEFLMGEGANLDQTAA